MIEGKKMSYQYMSPATLVQKDSNTPHYLNIEHFTTAPPYLSIKLFGCSLSHLFFLL